MPLSDEELRLLEQMERALAEEDPKFASTLQGHPFGRAARWRAGIAAVVFLAGVAVLLGGAMAQMTWVGVAGFVVMLASATIGLAAWRGRNAPPAPRPQGTVQQQPESGHHRFGVIEGGKAGHRPRRTRRQQKRPHRPQRHHDNASHPGHPGLVQRMEARWQRRRQQGY